MSSPSKSGSQKSNSPPRRPKRSRSFERRSPGHHRRGQNIPESNKLFVTNIDAQYSADDVKKQLEESFGTYGKIKDIIVKTKAGSSNSYAFIEFYELQSSVKALQNLRGMNFKGKELKVQYGKGEKKTSQKQLCYQCNRYGHYAKDCRDKPRYDRRDVDRRDKRDHREDRGRHHYDRDRQRSYRHQRRSKSRDSRPKRRLSQSSSYQKRRSPSYDRRRKERQYRENRSPQYRHERRREDRPRRNY